MINKNIIHAFFLLSFSSEMNTLTVKSIKKLQIIVKTQFWRSLFSICTLLQNIHKFLFEYLHFICQWLLFLHFFIIWVWILTFIIIDFLLWLLGLNFTFFGFLLSLDFKFSLLFFAQLFTCVFCRIIWLLLVWWCDFDFLLNF